ncbi:UPF0182 family membrane protein [Brachybacterium sp. AOP25-B2-12]|uniref:UPF0182 family membrane protein n=1 Tax=Brachybacterium sp. AOP25-B2-12 TaxID=3457710 RepID=UPI004033F4DA
MSFSTPFGSAGRPAAPRRGPSGRQRRGRISPLGITVVALVVLMILVVVASEVVTRYAWFDQLGFAQVLRTRWIVQGILFVAGALLFAIPLFLSLRFAHARRPVFAPVTREDEALEQFRTAVEPLRRGITILAPIVIGSFAGLAASRSWENVLLFLNAQDFGAVDPQFGFDVGFFVFTLPVVELMLSLARYAALIALVGGLIGHFVYGGVAWRQEKGLDVTRSARRHLGILAVVYLVILGLSHWVERYGLLTSVHDRFEGASYTDVHAILPAKTILAIAAVIVAAMFVLWIVRGDWRIPAIGAGLMLLSTLAVGFAYPALIEQFRVEPNARALERPYIERNIDATRTAFGLDDVEVIDYAAQTDATPGTLRADADATAQIRLLDPAIVSPTFGQREANRRYWGFDDILSVDRYTIDGTLQDTVIGVRELSPSKLDLNNQSWVNQHITYTHGFGVAAAYGNRRNADGEPAFIESGVPGQGALGTFEERVYFGRTSPDYSIVGAPEGATPEEFDYQSGTDENSEGTQRTNTFSGDGGPSIGNPIMRFLYAVKFRDPNIVISDYVNDKSQILYDRDPRQRVNAVAPFLSLDSGMYPAVVDGRLVWVVDGYTSTDRYPYAQSVDLDAAVEDSQTNPGDSAGSRVRDTNYLRNGVKATVDAYDGSVKLYAWDTDDPILKAWQQAFPGSIQDTPEISGDLMSHLRYPEDLFKSQRTLLAKYHVTNPDEFFGQQDFWQIPVDPTRAPTENGAGAEPTRKKQPPYYLSMQMPGQDSPRFSLSSSYTPADGQDVLSGFLAVDSETGDQAGNPAKSYGQLKLLNLPASNPVNGPGQVQATFNSDSNVSRALNLLKSGNSEVINGNLLTLPMGGGLLYVQPVYLQSSAAGGGAQYPLLQMVLVSFGDKIGFAPTLDEALDQVFGGDSGANAGDAGIQAEGEAGTAEGAGTDTSGQPAATGDAQTRLDQALADMQQAETDAQEALNAGDWTAYGEAQARLQDALRRALAANEELGGSSPSDGGGG